MQKLGVSRCTILRDVEALSCSYPIYTVQGHGGGIRVADGYCVDRCYLKSDQEVLLRELLAGLTPEKQKVMQGILDTFDKPKAPAASGRRSV